MTDISLKQQIARIRDNELTLEAAIELLKSLGFNHTPSRSGRTHKFDYPGSQFYGEGDRLRFKIRTFRHVIDGNITSEVKEMIISAIPIIHQITGPGPLPKPSNPGKKEWLKSLEPPEQQKKPRNARA